jgi:DNA-binding transcriptional MerR regulator
MSAMAIGELAQRAGLTPGTVRAWERRYGLLTPDRSDGGHRRYSNADLERLLAVRALVHDGVAVAVAARRVRAEGDGVASAELRRAARDVTRLFDRGEVAAASARVRAIVEAGIPASAFVEGVVVPVQRHAGGAWLRGRWTVANEHAVTAILDRTLTHYERTLGTVRGTVVMACAPDEWHHLPARAVASSLAAAGWEVQYLGPAVPADDLATFVAARDEPVAVALACSQPRLLAGAYRSLAALATAGVTGVVAVGGAGFGAKGVWAQALGVPWCRAARDLEALLAASEGAPPRPFALSPRSDAVAIVEALDDARHHVVPDAITAIDADRGDAATRSAHVVVDALQSATIVDDDTLLRDELAWLDAVAGVHSGTYLAASLIAPRIATALRARGFAGPAARVGRAVRAARAAAAAAQT